MLKMSDRDYQELKALMDDPKCISSTAYTVHKDHLVHRGDMTNHEK